MDCGDTYLPGWLLLSSLMSRLTLSSITPPRHLTPYYSVLSNGVNSRERFDQLPLAVIILMNINKQHSADGVSAIHAAQWRPTPDAEGIVQTTRVQGYDAGSSGSCSLLGWKLRAEPLWGAAQSSEKGLHFLWGEAGRSRWWFLPWFQVACVQPFSGGMHGYDTYFLTDSQRPSHCRKGLTFCYHPQHDRADSLEGWHQWPQE